MGELRPIHVALLLPSLPCWHGATPWTCHAEEVADTNDQSDEGAVAPGAIVNESAVERYDRAVSADAPRRDRLFAAATAKGIPLRTILTIDAVVIGTWITFRLVGRLREVILWVMIAGFIALVLNPAVAFLQRHRFRRSAAVAVVFLSAVLVFGGLLGLFGYPLVNSLTHVAERLPTMVDQVQRGHGWLAHTLERFGLLAWVQKNSPRLKEYANNLGKPALSLGANLSKAVISTIVALTTTAFLALFMLLEAPAMRRGLLGAMKPKLRQAVLDVSDTVSRSVTAYVIGTAAMGLLFGLVVFVTMVILGVPFALLIGLWVALVAMIPLVGGLIAGIPAVALAMLHSPSAGVVMLIVFVGFQLFENHFLYPVVMSRTVRMNSLWVLLSVLIGANLGGVFGSTLGALTGALVAIPVGGAIQVVFREVWERTRPVTGDSEVVDEGAASGQPGRPVGYADGRPGGAAHL